MDIEKGGEAGASNNSECKWITPNPTPASSTSLVHSADEYKLFEPKLQIELNESNIVIRRLMVILLVDPSTTFVFSARKQL